MNIVEAVRNRKTVRVLNDKVVSRELIEEIIENARFAPSVHNAQPWSFIILDENLENVWQIIDEGTKSAGLKNAWKKVRNANLLLAVCSEMPNEAQNSYESEMYFESMGAVIQNILLLSHAKGLGTCWLGGTIKRVEEDLKEYLKIPEELRLITLISFGFYDEENIVGKPKKTLNDILYYNSYGCKE